MARIDLTTDGVSLLTNDDNGDRPEETDGLRTTSFLAKHGCQLAVNAAPFWPIHAEEGLPQNVAGLVVSGGEVVSPWWEERPALVWTRDGKALITKPPFPLEKVATAVGGFGLVLKGGDVIDVGGAKHPRTAAGVADDGSTLLLMTVDGRQEGYSEGVTTGEVGRLLKRLGAEDGINLDGGGTTAMAIAAADGTPKLVNRPIHGGEPGRERVAASHLGVTARPLP